jgi:hypothetical protein
MPDQTQIGQVQLEPQVLRLDSLTMTPPMNQLASPRHQEDNSYSIFIQKKIVHLSLFERIIFKKFYLFINVFIFKKIDSVNCKNFALVLLILNQPI